MRTSVDLHNFLQSRDVPHEICLVEMPTRTASMAAASLGLDQSEIGKTLIVEINDNPVVVIIPGDRRIDMRKLKKLTGASKVKLANPDETVNLTGYVLGGTPPVAHASNMPIYIDHRLLGVPLLYTSGGQINTVLKIKPVDLIEAGNAQIADIADDGRV
ncbi:MAG: YbaK/EbsC family protein [Actinobacteria bacterium]|nr:YbaK/EbsC family protein [Actinomycetota bacterium]